MKIETKITINLDEKEYILTRIEAENLYHALKKELGISNNVYWPTLPQNPLPQYPMPIHTPTHPLYPNVWCATSSTNIANS